MAKCPTCSQELPLTWEGCVDCVRGAHHCSTPGCGCPICPNIPEVKADNADRRTRN